MAADAATSTRNRWFAVLVAAVLLVSLGLRMVTLTAALPYSAYVDEGHVVSRVAHMVGDRTWDPGWYRYPSLLMNLTAAGAVPIALTSDGLTDDADDAQADPYYDRRIVGDLLLVGRIVVLLAGVALVATTLATGVRARGRSTGLVAGALAAVAPALVSRGSIVIVDTLGALFVTVALLAAAAVGPGRRGVVTAAVAGAAAGLAITSKYTLAVVLLGVWAAIALDRGSSVARRCALVGVATVAAGIAAVVTMPALVLHPNLVRADLKAQADIYATKPGDSSYLDQLTTTAELGWLLPLVALVGLVVLALEPRARRLLVAWAVFALPFVGTLVTSDYQPFRNLLPLVPLACVAAAAAVTWGADAATRPLAAGRGVRLAAIGVATAILVAVAGVGTRDHLDAQSDRVDSRVAARQWLEAHAPPDGRVVVAEELAFLDSELARIPGDVEVRSVLDPTVDAAAFDFAVLPSYAGIRPSWRNTPSGWSTSHFGTRATTTDNPNAWRSPDQIVDVYATG